MDKLTKAKDTACPYITDCVNSANYESIFSTELKDAYVASVFRRTTHLKGNYRPTSYLPLVFKIFKRTVKGEIEGFSNPIQSYLLCGFRERYCTQHSIVRVLEVWSRTLDSYGILNIIKDKSQKITKMSRMASPKVMVLGPCSLTSS